jgi:hypothetical protein
MQNKLFDFRNSLSTNNTYLKLNRGIQNNDLNLSHCPGRALRRADLRSKESYEFSVRYMVSESFWGANLS